jgi:hypothetical protein
MNTSEPVSRASIGSMWLNSKPETSEGGEPSEALDHFEELLGEALNLLGDISYGEELNTRQLKALKEHLQRQNFAPNDPLYSIVAWLGIFTAIFLKVPNATQRHLQAMLRRADNELQERIEIVSSQSREQLIDEIQRLATVLKDMNGGIEGFTEVFNICMDGGGTNLAKRLVAPNVLDQIEEMIVGLQEQQSNQLTAREQDLKTLLNEYQAKFLEQVAGLENLKVALLHTVQAAVAEKVQSGLKIDAPAQGLAQGGLNIGSKFWPIALGLTLIGGAFGFTFARAELARLTPEQVAELEWAKSDIGVELRRLERLNPGISSSSCSPKGKTSVNGKQVPAGFCLIRVNPSQGK